MGFGVLRWQPCCPQGNSESDKYRFNTAFLTGSDYYRYPNEMGEFGENGERFLDNRQIEGSIIEMIDGAIQFVKKQYAGSHKY